MARENKDRVVEDNWDESSLAPRSSMAFKNKSQRMFAGGISGGAKTSAELPLFRELDGLVAVSKAVQKYAKQYCDLDAEMIPNHAWSYKDKDTGGWPRFRKNFAKQTS
ncbi:hypothetical protein LTR70_003207 [Exophiala xenobiotica]|uniref:Uncharacterized protein n=1 Tax=Lithohypha guttulata TaxID=1690604 RepID=A0ABR0KGX4_9EURO|nr:hypothetical protein LTR24_002852 [Lithohypha guttulata]KAK5323719.1 hypothetical protein LTR70_003207 [Exophiala xenobiotica]